MSARKLATTVYIDGQTFSPGDSPPKEIADQITNPKAWDDYVPPTAARAGGKQASSSASTTE